MNDDLKSQISGYIRELPVTDAFVSIRSTEYPPESIKQDGVGRFHRPGQVAYYIASGDGTARTEVYGSPSAPLLDTHALFDAATGTVRVFDFNGFLEANPNLSDVYFPTGEKGGWTECQRIRDALEELNCSGTMYPSQKDAGGLNLALWTLDGKLIGGDYFKKQADDPTL